MIKNVLIVEDNEIHMAALEKLLLKIPNLKIVKAYNMAEACYMLSLSDYDLFIIDIILDTKKQGDVSGVEFAKMLRDNKKYEFAPIIFTTSLEDPKLQAYSDLHCYQYIEKPFDESYVKKMVMEALDFPLRREKKEFAYFRKDGILYSVRICEITHIILGKPSICIYTTNDCLRLGYYTASDVQGKLGDNDFVRCNRNTMLNKNYIEYVDFSNGYVKLRNIEKTFEIGTTCKKRLKEEFDSGE